MKRRTKPESFQAEVRRRLSGLENNLRWLEHEVMPELTNEVLKLNELAGLTPEPVPETDEGTYVTSVPCPYCHAIIHGTTDNIDSGLRKHIDTCEAVTDEDL